MTTLGYEHGRDVLVNEDRPPVLYDAKKRPLVRAAGFRPRERRPAAVAPPTPQAGAPITWDEAARISGDGP